MEKKNLIGKKVRGFRFKDETLLYGRNMDNYVGNIGTINSVSESYVGVVFSDGKDYYYPLDQIEKHLIEDTPSQYEVGMTVWDTSFGKGKIESIDINTSNPIGVQFEVEHKYYTKEGKPYTLSPHSTLSLTPYDPVNGGATFPTFKPEVPEIEKGTLVYVKYGSSANWEIRFFSHFENEEIHCFYNQKKEGDTSPWPEYSLTNPLIGEKQ